jgi:hypothetical protein
MNAPRIEGHCDPRFSSVRDAFLENFRSRDEIGAAVAVSLGGELVVDLWAGHADPARTRPWQRDTLVHVYSTTTTRRTSNIPPPALSASRHAISALKYGSRAPTAG